MFRILRAYTSHYWLNATDGTEPPRRARRILRLCGGTHAPSILTGGSAPALAKAPIVDKTTANPDTTLLYGGSRKSIRTLLHVKYVSLFVSHPLSLSIPYTANSILSIHRPQAEIPKKNGLCSLSSYDESFTRIEAYQLLKPYSHPLTSSVFTDGDDARLLPPAVLNAVITSACRPVWAAIFRISSLIDEACGDEAGSRRRVGCIR